MRGNLSDSPAASAKIRSIPARAGEPQAGSSIRTERRVYPRACGGTSVLPSQASPAGGLSPRVRGNRSWKSTVWIPPGSIPARAGEPPNGDHMFKEPPVYPRACGGTIPSARQAITVQGLSPRVRGNLNSGGRMPTGLRSIPARAGEPSTATGSTTIFAGLSPRVRGNRPMVITCSKSHRSIPARAGEPSPPRGRRSRCKVYPRACGGTSTPVGGCRLV